MTDLLISDEQRDLSNTGSNYNDIDGINIQNYKYSSMHINIYSLPSKFDQLKEIIVKLKLNNTQIDFILLCETFLNDENADMYQIPGYSFIQKNRKIKSKEGVGIYISNQYTYYAAGIWGVKRYNSPDIVQRKAMRYFLGTNKFTAIPALEGDMGWFPPYIRHRLEAVRLFIRLSRMSPDRLTKRVFLWDLRPTPQLG